MIPVYVGFDPRESAVYHTFCQSVMDNTSVPVPFIPLHQNTLGIDGQQDGSNAFVYSRYLVPALAEYQVWAMFFDGDMVCRSDLSELWELRRSDCALMVVKHDYTTRAERKYIGTPLESPNLDYPRKNWSSVMLINCAHVANRVLTRRFVDSIGGEFLHRFAWLHDDEIGSVLIAAYERGVASRPQGLSGTRLQSALEIEPTTGHQLLAVRLQLLPGLTRDQFTELATLQCAF